MQARGYFATAGLLLAIATMVGALAEHVLQTQLSPAQLGALHTAVNYQFFNALGLLAVGMLAQQQGDSRWLRASASLLIVGIISFSGGIYIMLAGAPRMLGLVTPLGGVLLITGWLTFTIAALRR
ncbi:MAG: DUF423 domain-containing protein [Steroidobacteraceae bacterium]